MYLITNTPKCLHQNLKKDMNKKKKCKKDVNIFLLHAFGSINVKSKAKHNSNLKGYD